MSAIITEKFRVHNATQFYESFSEASPNTYYLFMGKSTAYTTGTSGGTDQSPPTPADDVSSEFYYWDDMLGAKKISSSEVTYSIPRRNFVNSTVYDMYEHNISSSNATTSGASNLYDSKFYFMTDSYRVYKVLDNNGGSAYSGSSPTSTSTDPFAIGGYVLQYIYTLTTTEVEKFLTTDFMPVSTDSTISSAATDGAIDSFIVTAGSGATDGVYYVAIYGDGTNAGAATGGILSLVVSGGAIASFGMTAGTDSTVHDAGAGYTYGTINLGSGFTFSDAALTTANAMGGSGASISVIIGPKGGHGKNAIEELGGHYVLMNATITQAEGDDFTTENDFRRVGLVVDPYDFGTSTVSTESTRRQTKALKLTSVTGTFDPDEKISQTTTGAIGKVVEWDSGNSILYYVQERFGDYGTNGTTGAFVAFSGANQVSGATSAAVGTPDADADSAVTLTGGNTITFSDGYANEEMQPDSGEIIYIENRKPISRSSDQTEDIKLIVEF
ncbi:uncharacterized protein METZ01_LOCUS56546 [marine metagenome]|uniref:Bacteriophage T4 Gp8 domain-containing protein n=1 Tax=marine metagenome TaxID=408172 RepID=A0A381SHX9_9ZZZZ